MGRVTEPAPKAAQALVTQDASDTAGATPPALWPDPPADMMQRVDAPSVPAPLEQTQNDAPAPSAMAQQPDPQPAATVDSAATAPASGGASAAAGGTSATGGGTPATTGGTPATAGGASVLQFIFAIIAFVGLVACPIFYIAGVRLRRTDVLSKAQHLNALPAEVPAAPAPTFQPLPPMDLMPRHDDVEEAMQRFSERWKRRAA